MAGFIATAEEVEVSAGADGEEVRPMPRMLGRLESYRDQDGAGVDLGRTEWSD